MGTHLIPKQRHLQNQEAEKPSVIRLGAEVGGWNFYVKVEIWTTTIWMCQVGESRPEMHIFRGNTGGAKQSNKNAERIKN